MKTATGTWVSPQFYYQGLKGQTYSKKMADLKTKIDTLIEEFATIKTNTKEK